MSKSDYKPVPRVRMTLTLNVQNRVLEQLVKAFGIMETYGPKMEITCYQSDFAAFMALLGKMDKPPTIKQLQMEHVDVRRDVHRVNVSQRGYACNTLNEPEGEPEDAEETFMVAPGASQQGLISEALLAQAQPKVLNLGALPDAVAANAQNVRGYLVPECELTQVQLSLRFPEGHPQFRKELWQVRSMSLPAASYWEWVKDKVWEAYQ